MVTQIVLRYMVAKYIVNEIYIFYTQFLMLLRGRKRGLILNISSISSVIPVPLLSAYGASKAYVNHFSQNIQYE